MAEIVLTTPYQTENAIAGFTLGPGARWERSMSHSITLWQIPGKGVDGYDLWLDTDEIRVTFPWYNIAESVAVQPKTAAAEFAEHFVEQRSDTTGRRMYTLEYPLGTAYGWVRNITFSQEAGHGDEIMCNLSFVVRHITDA